jgi:hypothetical protein
MARSLWIGGAIAAALYGMVRLFRGRNMSGMNRMMKSGRRMIRKLAR